MWGLGEGDEVDWEDNAKGSDDEGDADIFREVSTSTDNAATVNKKRKSRSNWNKEDRREAEMLHAEALLRLLWRGAKMNYAINDEMITVTLMSFIPSFLIQSARILPEDHVRDIVAWFNMTFTIIPNCSVTVEEGRDGSAAEDLLSALLNRAGSLHQLTQLFVCLLRICGFDSRYICTMDPPGVHPRNHKGLVDAKRAVVEQEQQTINVDLKSSEPALPMAWAEVRIAKAEGKPMAPAPVQSSTKTPAKLQKYARAQAVTTRTQNLMRAADEVIDLEAEMDAASAVKAPSICRWVHVDCNQRLIDAPRGVEERRRRRLMYVFAFDADGGVTDVTARYACQYSSSVADRLQETHPFLKKLLANWSTIRTWKLRTLEQIEDADLPSQSTADAEERAELQRAVAEEHLPVTLSEFKNHPKYALERDLKSDEVLHPQRKRVVGLVKGVSVYLREHVTVLRSKYHWRRQLRAIAEGETPYRSQQKKKGDSSVAIHLYGEWQTKPYVIPKVVDRALPVNKYGNIEVWDGDERLVPDGARLLCVPNAMQSAKKLGVAHAPAIFGFESRGMKSYPVIGGVVVLAEDADLIAEAALSMSIDKEEKQLAKQESTVLKRWETLVRSALSREELRVKYGH